MKTKLIIAILLISSVIFAQEKPSIGIPTYPDSDVGMEINLTKDDIIPTLGSMLPMLLPSMGKAGEAISVSDVISIFADVKSMEYLQMENSKQGISDKEIISFYSNKLPQGSWRMVFKQTSIRAGSVYVFSQSEMSSLYAFRVRSFKNDDGKTAKKIEVAKIDGKLDFSKLLPLALKIMNTKR